MWAPWEILLATMREHKKRVVLNATRRSDLIAALESLDTPYEQRIIAPNADCEMLGRHVQNPALRQLLPQTAEMLRACFNCKGLATAKLLVAMDLLQQAIHQV